MINDIINNLKKWPIVNDLDLIDRAKDSLEIFIDKDCEKANEYWYLIQYLSIRRSYELVFLKLKKHDFYDAWNDLNNLVIRIKNLKRMIKIPQKYSIDKILEIVQNYIHFFPYKWFTSREEIIKEQICSICGAVVNPMIPCGHIKGELYCGKLCQHVIIDIELLSIAIVSNPVDKYAVLFPEGMEYNYEVLIYLLKMLSDPYVSWDYIEKKKLKPEFMNFKMKQKCICGSNKKFKHCCYKKSSSWMDHIEFIIEKLDSKSNEVYYTSNSIWK